MNANRTVLSINWRLVGLLAAVMFIAERPTYGQDGSVGIAYPAKGITVDGNLSDWPAGLQSYPIERIEDGDKLGGEKDLKAHFRIAYNAGERTLYVAVEVLDDSIILDGPENALRNTQDGCEIFIDAIHSVGGSPVVQYARYGNKDRVVGAPALSEKAMRVAVTRSDSRIAYEWRVDLGGDLHADRVIGFKVAVADKDKDGSFSWATWGRGSQQIASPDRRGEILLVPAGTRFSEVSGRVAWKEPSQTSLPSRVRIQSSRSKTFWRGAIVDSMGAYKASNLPVGPYSIFAVDSPDLRVETEPGVDVQVQADRPVEADVLRVTPISWPGLIGAEGVLQGPGPVNPAELDRFVRVYMDYYKIPGISIAVIKDSEVVYHRGFGVKDTSTNEPVADDTIFEAASMTKPVLSYLVLRLVDRGILDLDTPLYTYLPYEDISHDDRYKLITARLVLTHRTGFPNWRTGKLDIKFTPGTEVSYSGEGFVYLGKVVEHLTGKKLVDLCREEVFTPLGVENASLVWNEGLARLTATGHDRTSPLPKWKVTEPNMAASLHINAGNYAKFLTAVLQGKGLAGPTAREMLRPQVKVPNEHGASWGLGIAIEQTPQGANYGHAGSNSGFTSRSLMYRDRGIGYVFLVNNNDARKMANVLNAYLITGKSGLQDTKPIIHKLAKGDPKVYKAYVGRYEIEHESVVTFTLEGDRLLAQRAEDAKFELFPESEAVFFLAPSTDATVTFVKDDRGNVTHAVLHRDGRDIEAKRIEKRPGQSEGPRPSPPTSSPLQTNATQAQIVAHLEQRLPELMRQGEVPGLAIALLRDGELVWHRGFGVKNSQTKEPVDDATVFEAASLSKPLMAYAVLKLVDAGRFEIDKPLRQYLPGVFDVDDPRTSLITARHVLSHRTGFPNSRSDGTLKMYFTPGERFSYSGDAFEYLLRVVEHVTGEDLNEFMKRLVFEPLGMTSSSFVWLESYDRSKATSHDGVGEPVGQGKPQAQSNRGNFFRLHTTPRDYGLFVAAILNCTGINPDTRDRMLMPQAQVCEGGPNSILRPLAKQRPDLAWGLGWGLQSTKDGLSFWHWGDGNNSKAYIVAYPKPKMAVVFFANSASGLSIAREIVDYAVGGEQPGLDWLNYERFDSPRRVLLRQILAQGVTTATRAHLGRQRGQLANDALNEDQIGAIGHDLLALRRSGDALEIFKLNVSLFPDSWNTHDSLAEGYEAIGDKARAINSFRRSLELNPKNINAAEHLRKLEADRTNNRD